MSRDWLADDRADLAAERILDAAARLFAERGVAAVGMGDIAKAAGCSRATLYRYFDNRQAVRLAFVHRATRHIAAEVFAQVAAIEDPGEKVVTAMLGAIAAVRADPLLIAWFRPGESGATGRISQDSDVIESIAAGLFTPTALTDPERSRLARWLTRIIVSFLAAPGRNPDEERAMLTEFVAPVIARAFV
ncbi:TetR/AcrR family transcriptional regulator [Nocardia yunnanensis]|uniref:TetR/AcrR family transcriptional regulator n=1 Tax=Nocardia yunnanensis TaxID=2382165 RepID=A0A386Z6X8_9NOCA|nr:helix-turn-helix domain-containing protein [Nocardia yunnanensis]AYF72844.1 TetR/AcrR family transcriptional regulator [Nocardia yunnanensis]